MFYLVGLSRSEIINEVLLFLVAGYDTSSSALSSFIHLVSKHPQVQQKIKEELIKNNENKQLTLDQLDSLVYLDCVIKEVLRFCPPALSAVRTLTVDDRLPESGYELHKGDSILIPVYSLQHNPEYWLIDPGLFYPERFLSVDKNHHRYAFIPFGGGHRACTGQDLALFQLKVIAARLMQYVTFGDGGLDLNPSEYTRDPSLRPKRVGVTVNFDE